MKAEGTQVAIIRWGMSGSGYEATDTAWVNLIELPNEDLLIVQQSMGPSTEESHGSYDYEHSIQVARSDKGQLVALLLYIGFDGESGIFDIEDLKSRCVEWEVPFTEGERAIG